VSCSGICAQPTLGTGEMSDLFVPGRWSRR
jgi:hypothetical protein